MTIYVINNMTIHDRAGYEAYLAGFLEVFRKSNGRVLAFQDSPAPIEGEWPYDRTVLLSFPNREDMQRWYDSEEYQALAKHRFASATSHIVVMDALPGKPAA